MDRVGNEVLQHALQAERIDLDFRRFVVGRDPDATRAEDILVEGVELRQQRARVGPGEMEFRLATGELEQLARHRDQAVALGLHLFAAIGRVRIGMEDADQVDGGKDHLHGTAQVVHERAGHLADERELFLVHHFFDVERVGLAQEREDVLEKVQGHGHRLGQERGQQVGGRNPRDGSGGFRAGIGAAALAIEHGDFTEEIPGQKIGQVMFAKPGRLDDLDLPFQHETNALGGIALAEKEFSRLEVLIDQVTDQLFASAAGKRLQEPVCTHIHVRSIQVKTLIMSMVEYAFARTDVQ